MRRVGSVKAVELEGARLVLEAGSNRLIEKGDASTWNGEALQVLYDEEWQIAQSGDVVSAKQPEPPTVSKDSLVTMAKALKDDERPRFVLKDSTWCPVGGQRELPRFCGNMPEEALSSRAAPAAMT